MYTSETTTDGRNSSTLASPSRPSEATAVSYPQPSSSSLKDSAITGSSSTMRMRPLGIG